MAARPLVARQPNERLQALIQEAGCSNAGLARRVNMCGAEHGLDLRYDKTSVARWLRGQQPRGRAPAIIAEALGRKLGRTVTIDEIGMANGKNLASGVGLQFSPTVLGAIEQVCELWRSDVGRRDFLSGSSVAASALVEPSRDWLITAPDPQVARTAGPRVGMSDVEAVRAMTQALVDLDHRFGSGHVRPVVVHYLNSVVSGLLAGSYREAVGRELFAAVARLTELAGYMAVDTGQPGLAQRYYIQALRLAQAAGDRGYGGYVLAASMSHLAAQLGNPREIAQLARAAQEGARGRVTPRAEAMFHAAEARGHALLGDVRPRQAVGRAGGRRAWSRPTGRRRTTRSGSRTSTRPTSPTSWRTATGTSGRPRRPRGARRRPWPATRSRGPAAGPSAMCCWPRRRCSSVRWSRRATPARGGGAAGGRCAPTGAPSTWRTSAAAGAVPGGGGGQGVRGAAGSAGRRVNGRVRGRVNTRETKASVREGDMNSVPWPGGVTAVTGHEVAPCAAWHRARGTR